MRRRVPNRSIAIGVALAAVLSIGACSDDSGSDEGKSSDEPAGPEVPESARTHTMTGAKEYARHYVDIVNRAADTGDTARLHDIAADCGYCRQFAAVYEDMYDNGGSFDGRPYELTGVEVNEQSSSVRAVVTLKSRPAATFQISKGAARRKPDARSFTWTLDLRHADDGWQIVGMKEAS